MSSDESFVEYVCGQASRSGAVTSRKMFGEFALYLDGKVIALVCDNQLFVKPTEDGRAILAGVKEAAPYPGAKAHLLVDDALDDAERMQRLFEATARALPLPKPKVPRKRRAA